MINVYFTGEAYYIVGKDIEIFSTLINPETDPIRRVYWAFLMLLPELAVEKDNVTFYNDSRFIDDMNGVITSLDDWTREAKRIGGSMLNSIYGIALFRKKDAGQLSKIIDTGRTKMIDPVAKQDIASKMIEAFHEKHSQRVRKLRQHYFGDKNGT